MFATETAYGIGERPQGIASEVGRRLAFEVHAEFPRYRHREVVYLMYQCIHELRPGGSRPDADYGTEDKGVRVCEPRVGRALLHQFDGVVYDIFRSLRMTEAGCRALYVVSPLRKEEIHYPSADLDNAVDHDDYIISSQKIGTPFARQSTTKWSNAFVSVPSGSSRKSLTKSARWASSVMDESQ